jgi:hypothetical protein
MLSVQPGFVAITSANKMLGTDVTDKYFARADVSEEFPFLMSKLSPYNDRF